MTERTYKVGDVVAWADVPDGALVRCDIEHQGIYFARRMRDRGWWAGPYERWSASGYDRGWDWGDAPFYLRGQTTIVALDLTGHETAADLQRLAEVFEVREAVCGFIRTSGDVHAAVVVAFMFRERERGRCTAEEAATRAAERLHTLGWRKGMTAEDAARLLAEHSK